MRVPIAPASDEDTDHSEIICMHFGQQWQEHSQTGKLQPDWLADIQDLIGNKVGCYKEPFIRTSMYYFVRLVPSLKDDQVFILF